MDNSAGDLTIREQPTWFERFVFGPIFLFAGLVLSYGAARSVAFQPAGSTIGQQLFFRAAAAPFFLLPTVFVLFGLRGMLGERRWIVRWLARLKFYLYLWIATVAGGILIVLVVAALP